jgi:hypothetical protein
MMPSLQDSVVGRASAPGECIVPLGTARKCGIHGNWNHLSTVSGLFVRIFSHDYLSDPSCLFKERRDLEILAVRRFNSLM